MTDPAATLVSTRLALQAVAEHVLSAAYHEATGHIGLRPSPGGFRTPPYPSGHGARTVGVDGGELVVVDDRGARRSPLTTVGGAAAFAEIEPGAPADVYTPSTTLAVDEPLVIDAGAARQIADWYAVGQEVLDDLRRGLREHDPSEIQLWPEHFDLAFSAGEVNWGVSPGDATSDLPYAYVGPWARPLPDGAFWNADFGAQRSSTEVPTDDGLRSFFAEGRRLLGL
ncbi:MAG: hypothetical protein ACTHN0_09735 [Aquihabitans sp.]